MPCVRVFLCARPLSLERAWRGLLTRRQAGRKAGGQAGGQTGCLDKYAARWLAAGVGKSSYVASEGRGDECVSPNLNCSSAVKPAISAHAQVVAHAT
jgi:hypothetical protein